MLIEPLVGAMIGGLVTYFIRVQEETIEKGRGQVVRLGEYFAKLSGYLREIQKNLSNGIVPIEAGNNVKRAMEKFSKSIENMSDTNEGARKELRDDHEALKQYLTTGAFLEEMVQGKILYANNVERKEKLYDLGCIAANLEKRGNQLLGNPHSSSDPSD
jgi:hypothetical protein